MELEQSCGTQARQTLLLAMGLGGAVLSAVFGCFLG